MSKERPDHADAQLVIQLYDLRREAVMRQSRDTLNGKFMPKTFEDILAITKPDHPMNAAWRQVTTYWEMTYGMAKHGIVNAEYFMENMGEGLLTFVKISPHLERYRKEISQLAFLNAEWVATQTERGRKLMELFGKRYQAQLAAAK
jgi:hypothetical protein